MPPRILAAGDSGPSPQGGSFISKVPTWVWYGIGVIAAIVIFMRLRGTSSGSTQSGSPIAAGADSSLLGAPAATGTLTVTSPAGSTVSLGGVNITGDDVSTIIKGLFPGGPTGGGQTLPTAGGTPSFLDWMTAGSGRTDLKQGNRATTAWLGDLYGQYIKEIGQWGNYQSWLKQPNRPDLTRKGATSADLAGEYIKESGLGPLR